MVDAELEPVAKADPGTTLRSKPVYYGTQSSHIGFAASWEEVCLILGLQRYKMRKDTDTPGFEAPDYFVVDPKMVSPPLPHP